MKSGEKILISDFHVGCQMWQSHALQTLGVEVSVASMSSHGRYLKQGAGLSGCESLIAKRMAGAWGAGWRGQFREADAERLLRDRRLMEALDSFDGFLCSFPPPLALLFLHLAKRLNKRVIWNMGHRFNLGVRTPGDNRAVMNAIYEMRASPRHVVAVMSEYDYHYVRYYLGIEPVRLDLTCFHVPLRETQPARREILVGPVHAGDYGADARVREMNSLAIQRGLGSQREPPVFKLIRSLYRNYELEDLRRHPAVVLLPYSAFSVSMAELYELGIPMFVPSVDFIVRNRMMKDRILHPIYCTENEYLAFQMGQVCPDYAYSPNEYTADAERDWLKLAYFYRQKNVVVWDSFEELLDRLVSEDLVRVRRGMARENESRREDSRHMWSALFLKGADEPAG